MYVFVKNRRKCSPTNFYVIINTCFFFSTVKSARKLWATSVIFVPTVNNRPMVKNSPNLVTVVERLAETQRRVKFWRGVSIGGRDIGDSYDEAGS
jgi:hypothetical protein